MKPWQLHPEDNRINDLSGNRYSELVTDLEITERLFKHTKNNQARRALNNLRELLLKELSLVKD